MNRIKVTPNQISQVTEFAIESHKHHYSNGRCADTIISNIIQGKLGEIAMYELDPDNFTNIPNFERTPDEGWDLVDLKGNKIDVKTIKKGTKTITFNSTVKADLYAIIEFDEFGWYYLKDIKTQQYLRNNMRKSKFNSSYYIFI